MLDTRRRATRPLRGRVMLRTAQLIGFTGVEKKAVPVDDVSADGIEDLLGSHQEKI